MVYHFILLFVYVYFYSHIQGRHCLCDIVWLGGNYIVCHVIVTLLSGDRSLDESADGC